jgi:hypothetical protein
MWQEILVIVIVAVCLAVTVRLLWRVLRGKTSTCSLCDQCSATKQCGTPKAAAKPPAGPPQR